MKRIKYIFLAAICLFTFFACRKSSQQVSHEQLKALVDQVSLPQRVDSTTTLVGMTLGDNVLTSRIEIPSERLHRINLDSLKNVQIQQLNTNLNSKKLRDMAVAANVTLKYVYVNGNDSAIVVVSPQEISH